MAFKHRFFDLDFRNDSINTQKDVADAFFQAHTIEKWKVPEHLEVIFVSYDENNLAGASRFTIFDVGPGGIKGNIATLNNSTPIANFIAANEVIDIQILENRIILLQYRAR